MDKPVRAPLTTAFVRRAAAGDMPSLGQVVARLSPLLLANAEYRLGSGLRTEVEPEDLVNEAWLSALPKLAQLSERDGRITPVLLKYLTTTINFRINKLLRTRLRRKTNPSSVTEVGEVSAEATGVVTGAVRSEREHDVRAALESLKPEDREVIFLRGIEQNSSKTTAVVLGITPAAVDKRFARALARLRKVLPKSVFDELGDELP